MLENVDKLNSSLSSQSNPFSCVMKWYFIKSSKFDQWDEAEALSRACKINNFACKNNGIFTTYWYAKAICKDIKNRPFFWQVRVIEFTLPLSIHINDNKKNVDQVEFNQKHNELLINCLIEPGLTYIDDELNIEKFRDVLASIQRMLQGIEIHCKEFIELNKIQYKLKKSMVYLLLASQWPYLDFEESSKEVINFFNEYYECIISKKLTSEAQTEYDKFMSQFNKYLYQRFITLDNLNYKITTKIAHSHSSNQPFFEKVRKLFSCGIRRILQHSKITTKEISEFCRIFSSEAYVYRLDSAACEKLSLLEENIFKLTRNLEYYDRQNGSTTLFEFVFDLIQSIYNMCENKSNIDLSKLLPSISVFEIIAKHDKAIYYMKLHASLQKQVSQDIIKILTLLISVENTWKATANYIISMGQSSWFSQIMQTRFLPTGLRCLLSEEQLEFIFKLLNENLREDQHFSFQKEYKEMYLFFLNSLTQINSLYFLRHFAMKVEHQTILRNNLVDLFSLMHDPMIPLEFFFSNALFRAINCEAIYRNIHIQPTLVQLFSGVIENPIIEISSFKHSISFFATEFDIGFGLLCKEIISQIGRSSFMGIGKDPQQELKAVEDWLKLVVIPIYQFLKLGILRSLPLEWFSSDYKRRVNLLSRICLHQKKIYKIFCKNDQLALKNIVDSNEDAIDIPSPLLYSDLFSSAQALLKQELEKKDIQETVSFLTEICMSLHNGPEKEILNNLLDIIFDKMRLDYSANFKNRLIVVANFLQAMSPFLKKIEFFTKTRFFYQEKLKNKIVLNLIKQIPHGTKIGNNLFSLTEEAHLEMNSKLVNDLGQLISFLCIKDIEEILNQCQLSQLVEVANQFENVICRKLDELSYSKEEFIDAFCEHSANSALQSKETLKTIMGDLSIKQEIIDKYADILKERPIPIHFILPNQALAIQLCINPTLQGNNLLIKLGTGQGKSMVIALAALHEAQQIKDAINGVVFVFTSYAHLAARDHALSEAFFKKEGIGSLCISDMEDVQKLDKSVKIIYADIDVIDDIMRQIMLKLLGNKASLEEKQFIKMIYGTDKEDVRIILDEYDLLLYDLEQKSPFVTMIPDQLLTAAFVRKHYEFCPELLHTINHAEKMSADKQPETRGIDPSSGKCFALVSIYTHPDTFMLLPTVLRLSQLMKRAKRVIGLSGTASQSEKSYLKNVLYFEIPSSQNPQVFGTQIGKANAQPVALDKPHIQCHRERIFKAPTKATSSSNLFIIPEYEINNYFSEIIKDVKEIQKKKQKDGITYQRPILIFIDPLLKYKINEKDQKGLLLWNQLKIAMTEAGIPVNELKEGAPDFELQQVGRSGAVTLSSIQNGRGSDVRVSLDIEEGLHVIIGLPVIHERLLQQLIGRTGRMGRSGSYSIITMGDLISPPSSESPNQAPLYQAIHDVTRLFVNKLINSNHCSIEDAGKWLMFLGKCVFINQKMKKEHVMHFCGEEVKNNPLFSSFYI